MKFEGEKKEIINILYFYYYNIKSLQKLRIFQYIIS